MTTFHTYIGECCREWPMAAGFPVGRCGLCGERPEYKRQDPDCSGPCCASVKAWVESQSEALTPSSEGEVPPDPCNSLTDPSTGLSEASER